VRALVQAERVVAVIREEMLRLLRHPPLWLALVVAGATLGVAWSIQEPCIDPPGGWDGFQYENFCYNEPLPLWYARHLGEDNSTLVDGAPPVPYLEAYNEYPPLTAAWMWLTALPVDDAQDYYRLTSALFAIVALGATALLWHATSERWRIWMWAAAPSLALLAFNNWDMLAVFFLALGVYYHRRGDALMTGFALGLGAAAKIFPGLLLPMIGLQLLRRDGGLGRDGWRFGLAGAGTVAFFFLPLTLMDVFGVGRFLEMFEFQLARDPSGESLWQVLHLYSVRWGVLADWFTLEHIAWYSRLLFLGGLLVLGTAVWKRRLTGLEAGFGAVLVMLVANQVYSVQYMLWAIPFLPVVAVRWSQFLFLSLADTLFHMAFFLWLLGWTDATYERLAFTIALRNVALVWVFATIMRTAFRRASDDVAAYEVRAPGTVGSDARAAPEG